MIAGSELTAPKLRSLRGCTPRKDSSSRNVTATSCDLIYQTMKEHCVGDMARFRASRAVRCEQRSIAIHDCDPERALRDSFSDEQQQ